MDYEKAIEHRRDCGRCGYVNGRAVVIIGPFGPNYARMECPNCGAWWDWTTKPGSEKSRRPAAHRKLVHKYSRGFCEICFRPETALDPGHTLTGHHVIEFQDGGNDSRENTWILCTGCHRLVHWVRTYVGGVPKSTEDNDHDAERASGTEGPASMGAVGNADEGQRKDESPRAGLG